MEVHDDRPASVYDNLNTSPSTNSIRVHTSTPKILFNSVNNTANSAIETEKLQQSLLKQIPTCLSQRRNLPKSMPSDFTGQSLPNNNGNGNINNYIVNNTSNNKNYHHHHHSINDHANTSITMPTAILAPQNPQTSPHTTTKIAKRTTMSLETVTSISSQPVGNNNQQPNATNRPQRPLSQHSQSELNESSQSIAAVKAALNDAKSKFFGLNGYAEEHSNNARPSINQFNNNNNNDNPNEFRLKQQALGLPRLLTDNQFANVEIVTTAPTPPPKIQPKYQNIPENSAIYRNNHNAHQQQQQQETPPELPPKPVEAIAMPSKLPAPTSYTQPDGVSPTSQPNSEVLLSSNSGQSSATRSPSPISPLDSVKISLSPSNATYKQIPLSDIDTSQPSQAVYMSTTVPQNIKGSKIAGRHTPTRNSLRHSRMLVVNNKTYPAIQHPNPMNFKYPQLARWLLILEIIVGLLISFLAIWIFCLAPNTPIQYNPYWSGLVLLLTGILGLVLVRYQRIKRHKVRENCFKFLRANIYIFALLTIILCAVALFCATLQYLRLTANSTHCASSNPLLEEGACTCTFNLANDDDDDDDDEMTPAATNTSNANEVSALASSGELLKKDMTTPEIDDDESYKVEYRDLSCDEVRTEWIKMLKYSIALNSIGLLLAFIFAVLLLSCRKNSKRLYTSVHTSTF